MKPNYDVVVIGAGPAGSIAARTTAQLGLSTLLLEKRQEIGSPVRCAEAVGRETVAKFIPLDLRWIATEIDTFSVTNALGDSIVLPPLEKTLVLERKLFDRELAHSAARGAGEGARVGHVPRAR
jgi:digeranylgeranylglycerophospholipid reductase